MRIEYLWLLTYIMIREFESKQDECLVILMEECAELIQTCSKLIRKNEKSSVEFTMEVGDVIAMLHIAHELGMYDETEVLQRAAVKKTKLKKWSNLYNETD